MKKPFFIRAICLAAVLLLCFSTAVGANSSDNMIKLLSGTVVCSDPGLQVPYGVLSTDSVVYAGECVFSSGSAALEITFSYDHIIRTGYIPLMSGINTLTDAEAEEYAAKAPEGILFKPGIVLFDVSFTDTPSFTVTEAVPEGNVPDEVPSEPSVVPADPSEPDDFAVVLPDESASQGFDVQPEAPFAGGAAIPGFVKTLDSVKVCIEPALQRTMDELPAGAIVYAQASDPANGAVEIVFCVDYIIRTGYISGSAVGPLTDSEAAEYAEKALDGITFKPGIVLLNTSSMNSTAPEQPDPSEVAAFPRPDAFPPAAEPTAAPVSPANNSPVGNSSPTAEELFPANPETGTIVPLPLNKRYLLNPDDPVPSKQNVSTITLPVYSPGQAEGIIDFAVLDDGILVVVSSIPFSLEVKPGTERLSIPVNFSFTSKTYVLVRFIPSACTCQFAAKASRRDQLVYFDERYSVYIIYPQVVDGYKIYSSIN